MITESIRLAVAFFRRDFHIATSYKFNFLFELVAGIFIVALFYFISRLMDSNETRALVARFQSDYFSYVLIGVAGAGFLHTGLTGFADKLRTGMTEGSLEMTFSCPVRPIWILLMPCLWTFCFDSLKVLVMILFGTLVFGADLGRANLDAGLAVMLVTILSYSVFGILSASMIMVFKKGDPINTAFAAASTLIGGAFFPVELLPTWLGGIAKILPMTYAYEAMRKTLLLGAGLTEVWPEFVILGVFSMVGLPLAIGVANLAIAKSKQDGTLGTF